jgi:hypothetical protein
MRLRYWLAAGFGIPIRARRLGWRWAQSRLIRHFSRNGPPSRRVLAGINAGGLIGGYTALAIEHIAKRRADRKRNKSN